MEKVIEMYKKTGKQTILKFVYKKGMNSSYNRKIILFQEKLKIIPFKLFFFLLKFK